MDEQFGSILQIVRLTLVPALFMAFLKPFQLIIDIYYYSRWGNWCRGRTEVMRMGFCCK